jgi:hypothetical protein
MQYQPLVLPLERGGSSAVGRGRPDTTQYSPVCFATFECGCMTTYVVLAVLLVVVGSVGPTTTNSTATTTFQR